MDISTYRERLEELRQNGKELKALVPNSRLVPVEQMVRTYSEEIDILLRRWSANAEAMSNVISSAIRSYIEELLGPLERDSGEAILLLRRSGAQSSESLTRGGEIVSRLEKAISTANDKYRLVVFASLDSLESSRSVASSTDLLQREGRLLEMEEKARELISTLSPLIDNVRQTLGDKSVVDAIGDFSHRALAHERSEENWRNAVGAAAVGALVPIVLLFCRATPKGNAEIVQYLAENIVLFGLATVALRVTIKRWNLERNLAVLYAHRVAALGHYQQLNSSIQEADARDRLRTQVMPQLYADPATGYREDTSSDVNITPTVAVLDRFGKLGGIS